VSLLTGFRVVQVGPGLAAAVCGRLLADAGASVACTERSSATPLEAWAALGKPRATEKDLGQADLLVCEGAPLDLRARGRHEAELRRLNARAALVLISPFGQTGPRADEPASDLTLFCASGIARLLTGQVDDLAEPPIRPVGEQSAFIGGLAAACAGMHAALARAPAVIDVSVQEALATLAITELARVGLRGACWSRKRVADGNGATVCILPASDGYAAISPREERQWASWLRVMGSPDWGDDPRFLTKADRVANWDALHALMSAWSRRRTKRWIAGAAQQAHVPCFPLCEPVEQLQSPQLAHRRFWRVTELLGDSVRAPSSPFGVMIAPGSGRKEHAGTMPLDGVRVLDFSWVIAGPTTTRYLAAMGAEVIKVEAPGKGDPGRASELHTVLGQGKRSVVLDLKQSDAVTIVRELAGVSDVLIENFATGVMERLGLGLPALREINPNLIYVSASGLGRTGPESLAVAYGTLLQCYAGFAGLNRHQGVPPRVGMAWLDPMCGLILAFIVAAAIWHRRRAEGIARVDFSMIEAMLWTMAGPLLAAQLGRPEEACSKEPAQWALHAVHRTSGDDAWVGLSVTTDAQWHRLCEMVPGLSRMADATVERRVARRGDVDALLRRWFEDQQADGAAGALVASGIPAAAVATSLDLLDDAHLQARGFWDTDGTKSLPGLPWRASFGRRHGPAPDLGADTEAVLRDVLAGVPRPAASRSRVSPR
jgi:crotonobetainyl-CoA:carnitine CoA-transferase CaiB-like acyl-CoA transferase